MVGEALAFHLEGMVNDNQKIPDPRSVEEIQRDPSLQEWREGAALCIVPVILDKRSPRRIDIAVAKVYCKPSTKKQGGAA